MAKFKTFLEGIGDDITRGFEALGSGIRDASNQKTIEYANRILKGQDPKMVLQGIGPAMTNLVMQKVQELRGGAKPQAAPTQAPQQQPTQPQAAPQKPQAQLAQPGQFSVSALENKLGVRSGTLSITPSGNGQLVFVRNRQSGQSVSVQQTPQAIEAAAKQVLGMV